MKIFIKNLTYQKIDTKIFKVFIKDVLKIKGIKTGEINITFVGDKRIKSLNRLHRNENSVTNSLTFNLGEEKKYLSEIIISIPQAKRESKILGIDLLERLKRLIVHGVLHSLDYCDYTSEEDKKMELEENKILFLLSSNKNAH